MDDQWAAVYLRISRDPRRTELGVRRQEKACRELLYRLGWRSRVKVYKDNDVTAYDANEGTTRSRKPRAAYEALVADVEARHVSIVATYDLDRMQRSMRELEDYITACGGDRGIATHSVQSGETRLDTVDGRMYARIKCAVSRAEVERAKARSAAEIIQRREDGRHYGGRDLFGYRKTDKGRIKVEEDQARAIREGATVALAGGSFYGVADAWNRQGFLTSYRKPWTAVGVRRVLTNLTLAGLLAPVETDPVKRTGDWEPILSEETVRALQVIAEKRKGTPGPKPKYLLTGLLECGVCGNRVFSVMKDKHGTLRYVCIAAWRGKELPAGVKKGHLGRQCAPADDFVTEWLMQALEDEAASAFVDRNEDLSALRARLAELETRKADYENRAAAGEIDPEFAANVMAKLRPQIDSARAELDTACEGSPLTVFAGRDPRVVWESLTPAERRAVAARLIDCVVVKPLGKGANYPARAELVPLLDKAGPGCCIMCGKPLPPSSRYHRTNRRELCSDVCRGRIWRWRRRQRAEAAGEVREPKHGAGPGRPAGLPSTASYAADPITSLEIVPRVVSGGAGGGAGDNDEPAA